MQRRKLWLLPVLAIMQMAASGQEDSPISLPELKRDNIKIEVLEYPVDLPTNEVARIDDRVLTMGDLLKQMLRINLNTIADSLLNTRMVELELQREGVVVSEEECLDEVNSLMPRLAPGKTIEEVIESGLFSRSYLMRSAMVNRGWKLLFWKNKNIPEDQRSNEASQILIQVYMNEVKGRYQLGIRGQNPQPPKGAIASLDTLISGKRVSYVVTPVEAMEFMLGVLRPSSVIAGQKALPEGALVEGAMKVANVTVTDTEIEAWVRAQNEKYPPPFNWPTLLRLKGTNADEERERYRHVLAWRRCTGTPESTEADIDAFVKANEDFFRGRHVKASHVLCKFVDDVTGLSKGNDSETEALARAKRVYDLASEGTDFKTLAERYSDDEQTKKGGGAFTQPIKKWGGGYDPAFQAAAYALSRPGELTAPVKSVMGWHVIMCNEVNPATDRAIDWKDPRYAEWVLEEYETATMKAWKESLAVKRTITKVGATDLVLLKQAAFPKKSD